ncbi:MAG: phage major capsid protein [Epsilonproteobacteria bacterium]|nr:phage major capsid protein [Campylobacterota bacterium]
MILLEQLIQARENQFKKLENMINLLQAEQRDFTEQEEQAYTAGEAEYDKLDKQIKRIQANKERKATLDTLIRKPLVGSKQEKENNKEERRGYSLFRAINALIRNDWSNAELERSVSIELSEKLGRDTKGVFLPLNRALTTSNVKDILPHDYRDDMYIDILREESLMGKLGATILPNLHGDVDIPKALGGMTVKWLGEGEDTEESEITFSKVTLSPKTVSGAMSLTRRLLKQSQNPAIEKLIEDNLRKGIVEAIDKAILVGDGTNNTPKGILNIADVQTVAVAGDIPTYEELIKFETALATKNALKGSLQFILNPALNGNLKTEKIDVGRFINENNSIIGYPAISSNLIPNGELIFGNFNDVIIGFWDVLELVVDTATMAKSGGVVLRVFQDMDVVVRHPESFAIKA